jgi:tRNA-dihydrouridine synthase A
MADGPNQHDRTAAPASVMPASGVASTMVSSTMLAPTVVAPTAVGSYRFSVAPMLDYTDRHFRVLMRQITRRSLLYSEMVVAQAIHHCDKPGQGERLVRLLGFDPIEKPLALQLGGDDPALLAAAARLAAAWGYDEVNLNVGCPSEKVQKGRFGACLMAEPGRVADCIAAMAAASGLPVSIKHRIGIDRRDSYGELLDFVDTVAAGACRFSVHARKAWLEGLDPKQNRTVPPLRYELVHQLKRDSPSCKSNSTVAWRTWPLAGSSWNRLMR